MTGMKYFSYLVAASGVFCLLFGATVILLFARSNRYFNLNVGQGRKPMSFLSSYFSVSTYQFSYLSVNPCCEKTILFCTRLFSFGYIGGISTIWYFIRNDWTNLFYFTAWNLVLLSCYFGIATFSSLVGLIYHPELGSRPNNVDERRVWSLPIRWVGFIQQLLFPVTGATSLFISMIIFVFGRHPLTYWNVSVHLVGAIAMLVELGLNAMLVRWYHVLLHLLWLLAYISYVWAAVASKALSDWPYDFVRTDSPACFLRYFVLFLLNVGLYAFWFYLARFKYECLLGSSDTARAVVKAHCQATGVPTDDAGDIGDIGDAGDNMSDSTADPALQPPAPRGRDRDRERKSGLSSGVDDATVEWAPL